MSALKQRKQSCFTTNTSTSGTLKTKARYSVSKKTEVVMSSLKVLTFRHGQVEVTKYDEAGSVECCNVVDAGGRLIKEDALFPALVVVVPGVLLRRVNIEAVASVKCQQLSRDLSINSQNVSLSFIDMIHISVKLRELEFSV